MDSSNQSAGDCGLGLLPIDVRVATLLAGIQADTQSTTRSNTNLSPVPLEQQEGCLDKGNEDIELVGVEETGVTLKHSKTISSRCNKSSARKHRYRDDRQKLSNSLAQKRYRERKKKAFDDLKSLVDCMTLELQQMRHVKSENERLLLEVEEYKQLALMREACRKEKAGNGDLSSTNGIVAFSSSPSTPTSTQATKLPSTELYPTDFTSASVSLMNDLEDTGPIGVLKHICSRSNVTQSESSTQLAARVEMLEREWEGRISAVEQFLRFHRSCGTATFGASNAELQSAMKDCMANMYTINSELSNAKLLHLAEDIEANSNRVRKAFVDFVDDAKMK